MLKNGKKKTQRKLHCLIRRVSILCLLAVILTTTAAFGAAKPGIPNIKGYAESPDEQKIYSYVQVPLKYYNDPKWTGPWVNHEWGGQKFFYFGCGICCLTNMYCTMTSGKATPEEMLGMAKKYTDYNPESGRGALSWRQLKSMCNLFGLDAEVKNKPSEYESFKNDVAGSETTMVLVCKDNDDKLWFYTNGHYVNLWEYDPATDSCFVTDSSGLFNRDRVALSDVYAALKTSSDAQYMTVNRR